MKRLAILLSLIFAFGCQTDAQKALTKKDLKDTQLVTYSYECGSLPTEMVRNYAIEVTAGMLRVVMWNASGETQFVEIGYPAKQWEKFKKQLASQGFSALSEPQGAPAPGAGTETVACSKYTFGSPYFKAFASKDYGTLRVKSGNPADAFFALLPQPIEALLDTYLPLPKPQAAQPQGTISDAEWAATTAVRYDFTDSSTAPSFHRSFSITIDKDSIVVDVTCYGDLLSHNAYPFTAQGFNSVKAHLASQGIRKGTKRNEPEPTGGKTYALSFYRDGEATSYFSAYTYAGNGTLYIERGTPAEAFVKVLPEPIDTIVNRTRK
ncbi:MAG: hypothetical protein J6M53_06860 [Bacteroidaceae bacterium]|nr:hypothetical protein [Bacteroidaceae bacterium]